MKTTIQAALLLAFAVFAWPCSGQDRKPAEQYVTREEYNRLLKELEAIKAKLQQGEEKKAATDKETEATFDDYEKELKNIKSLASSAQSGTTKPLLTGYGFAGFASRKGETSTFSAGLSPILLWKLSDRLFFEGEVELSLNGNTTEVSLEYANLSYVANDILTLKAGRFLSPFNSFAERFHAAWVNKLPDAPLPFREEGGLAPTSELGVQASGGFAAGSTKLNYAVFVSNGPQVATGATDPTAAGLLGFDNHTDLNNNKAVGARLGFLPFPELEVGYAFQYARVGAGLKADAYLHAVDLNYVRDSQLLRGTVDFKAQWMWSLVDNLTYDPTGVLGFGPVAFNNRRDGGYLQLAYRPSKVDLMFIKDSEMVCRYDLINRPDNAPLSTDERRWTVGLNHWLGPSTVVKVAYEFGDRRSPGAAKADVRSWLLQAAMGF